MDEMISVSCKYCDIDFLVTLKKFKSTKSHKNRGFICSKCKSKLAKINSMKAVEKLKSLSEKEKELDSKRRKDIWTLDKRNKQSIKLSNRYKNLSKEEKELDCQRKKDGWANKPEEEIKEYRKLRRNKWNNRSNEYKKLYGYKISCGLKNRSDEAKKLEKINKSKTWYNRPKEVIENQLEILHNNYAKWYNNLSPEEYINQCNKISSGRINYNKKLSPEEINKRNEFLMKIGIEYLSNETKEQKISRYKKSSITHIKNWNNKSEKEKKDRSIKSKNYHDNLTSDEKIKWYKYQSEGIAESEKLRGPTESIFANDLNKYSIKYKWGYSNNTIHPDFYKLFPHNYIIDINVNPFHAWDFIIYTKQGNILVDLDGGKHNIPECYETGARIQFNDSQRPYQTDNMDAYIILAYNDIITDDTVVLELKNKEFVIYGNYQQFILYLSSMNYSDKELKELLDQN